MDERATIFLDETNVRRAMRWLDALTRAVAQAERIAVRLSAAPATSAEAAALRVRLAALSVEIEAIRRFDPNRNEIDPQTPSGRSPPPEKGCI